MFHENLADKSDFAILPISAVQEKLVGAFRQRTGEWRIKLVSLYALKHGQQLDIPHSGKVVPEMMMAKCVPNTVRKITLIDRIAIHDSEVIKNTSDNAISQKFTIWHIE